MPLFPTRERTSGLRFPTGTRGLKQSCLCVVGTQTQPIQLKTKIDPNAPLSSFEKLKEQMVSNGELIREAMNRGMEYENQKEKDNA